MSPLNGVSVMNRILFAFIVPLFFSLGVYAEGDQEYEVDFIETYVGETTVCDTLEHMQFLYAQYEMSRRHFSSQFHVYESMGYCSVVDLGILTWDFEQVQMIDRLNQPTTLILLLDDYRFAFVLIDEGGDVCGF